MHLSNAICCGPWPSARVLQCNSTEDGRPTRRSRSRFEIGRPQGPSFSQHISRLTPGHPKHSGP